MVKYALYRNHGKIMVKHTSQDYYGLLSLIVFNRNHFEMRLLNLRINFFIYFIFYNFIFIILYLFFYLKM